MRFFSDIERIVKAIKRKRLTGWLKVVVVMAAGIILFRSGALDIDLIDKVKLTPLRLTILFSASAATPLLISWRWRMLLQEAKIYSSYWMLVRLVCIGNFYLDCAYGPTLWRYYSDGKEAFEAQIQEYKNSFPFLDLSNVKFRLFQTKEFGIDYELPR